MAGGMAVRITNPGDIAAGGGGGGVAQGNVTDRSGACNGSSASAAAAKTDRRYLLIQNPTTAAASFWVRLDGSTATQASPSIEVAPGVTFAWEGTFIPTGALTVIGANGLAYTIKEG